MNFSPNVRKYFSCYELNTFYLSGWHQFLGRTKIVYIITSQREVSARFWCVFVQMMPLIQSTTLDSPECWGVPSGTVTFWPKDNPSPHDVSCFGTSHFQERFHALYPRLQPCHGSCFSVGSFQSMACNLAGKAKTCSLCETSMILCYGLVWLISPVWFWYSPTAEWTLVEVVPTRQLQHLKRDHCHVALGVIVWERHYSLSATNTTNISFEVKMCRYSSSVWVHETNSDWGGYIN